MAYLIPYDYKVNIQDINIQQIINSDESIRDRAQLAGEAEAQSYLKQKYYIAREFQDILPYSFTKVYVPFNRFYLDAAVYSAVSNYSINDLTLAGGSVWICTANTSGAFDPTAWTVIGKQYTIFHVLAPYPEFNYTNLYNIGDVVFFKGNIYTCRVQTSLLDHDTALQYRTIENLPLPNVAPDDPISGIHYWGAPTVYIVNNELPTNTNIFSQTDNRDAQMVLYTCDIVLYHLHARIAPRNIPDLRVKRYDDAIAWLKMCAEGAITPNLPLIQPKQGNRIRYGGNIRQINSY